jgi:hypothetical protein
LTAYPGSVKDVGYESYMVVSINGGIPKWRLYSGKSLKLMIGGGTWGYLYFKKPPYGYFPELTPWVLLQI